MFYSYEIRKSDREPIANLAAYATDIRSSTFKGKFLYSEYRTGNFMLYNYPLFFIMRRILVSCILVWWNDDGFYQLLFLSTLSVINLTYHCAYQPFISRVRNVSANLNELMYLSICMLMFPYVYPEIEDDLYYRFPLLFITIFSIVFVITMAYGVIGMLSVVFESRDSFPIEEQELDPAGNEDPKALRNKWLEGQEPIKKQPTTESLEAEESEQDSQDQIQPPPEEAKKAEESKSESSEEEEEESDSEESSSSESNDSMGPDLYANTKNIPNADVRLDDAGYSTGLSGMREARLQQYRNFEESGKMK